MKDKFVVKINGWIFLGIIISSILLAFLLIFSFSNTRYQQSDEYWSEVKLSSYLADTYTDLEYNGGGNGNLHYTKDGKDYLIQCSMKSIGSDMFSSCCKEGEVSWEVKYDDETFTWINIINKVGDCE